MENFNQLANKIYQIHEQGKNMLSRKEISLALKLEALLFFNYLHQATKYLEDLRYLLQGMHKIGKDKFTSIHYELDIINQNLDVLSSKTQMENAINSYNQLEMNLRLFDLKNLNETNKKVDFYDERIKIYTGYFQKIDKNAQIKVPQVKNYIPYINLDGKNMNIAKFQLPFVELPKPSTRKGGDIKIKISDLKIAAKEMDEILATSSIDKENYVDRMEKFEVFINLHYGLDKTEYIVLKEVCHIIGMVGTGKSTLIQVLVYYLSKNGYRTMVLFETVKDVLVHADLFEKLGVITAAINGEKKQENRVQKVVDYKEMILPDKYAHNLLGNCYISQLMDGIYDDLNMYGEEPCYRMKYEGKTTICPFYSICPRKYNSKKLFNASAIFANINSFLYNRTAPIKGKGRLLLLEYAIEYVDVVIFDEADALQIKLDNLMNESEYIETILGNHFSELENYLKRVIDNSGYHEIRDLDVKFRIVLSGLDEVKELLLKKSVIEKFKQIKYGQWFSAYVLSQSIDFLPDDFVKAYDHLIRNNDDSFLGIAEAYLLDTKTLNQRYYDLFNRFNIQEEDHLIVRFLMALVITEKNILFLHDELEKIQKISNDVFKDSSLPNIFKRPNANLLRILPKSPTNNRFGFLYDKNQNRLQIFRQQAIGRSVMTDLPYLKIGKNGEPLGPHTVLLSATSCAPGSSEHHIYRPVNYILQPTSSEIQDFINSIKIQYVNTQIKVSGTKDKKAALKTLCNSNKELFMDSLNEEGRSLIIVNSYLQAEWVQEELKRILPTNIFRLVPDFSARTLDTIQRSKVNSSKEIDYKFLVAPAISIARGFNIVDNTGHSLFNKMFVLVRPMTKPKEIEKIVSIVNGEVIRMRTMQPQSSLLSNELERIKECQRYAHKVWNDILRDSYGIQYADELLIQNIVVSRLILLIQLIGRLLRITNLNATPPEIILLDDAFVGQNSREFNLLKEMEEYLEDIINDSEYGLLAKKLYGPFLEGLKRGKALV